MKHPVAAAFRKSQRCPNMVGTLAETRFRETEQQFRTRVVELLKRSILDETCFRKGEIKSIPCDDIFVTELLEAVASTDSEYNSEIAHTEPVIYSIDENTETISSDRYREHTVLARKGERFKTRYGLDITTVDIMPLPGVTTIYVDHTRVGTMEIYVKED
jgi:hypothetical protein